MVANHRPSLLPFIETFQDFRQICSIQRFMAFHEFRIYFQ